MRALAICVLPILCVLGPSPVEAGLPAALEPLSFLLGQWESSGGGEPGDATGSATFATGLQDQVILRTSFAAYPASGTKPSTRHDDLMVIYAAAGGIASDYYDSEGHRIHYTVAVPSPGEATFVSDAVSGAPRFRLTYKLDPDGRLEGEFAIATPDNPEQFSRYLAWEAKRATGGAPVGNE